MVDVNLHHVIIAMRNQKILLLKVIELTKLKKKVQHIEEISSRKNKEKDVEKKLISMEKILRREWRDLK